MAHSLRRSAIVYRFLLRHLVSDSLPRRLFSHRIGVSLIRQCSLTGDVNIGMNDHTRRCSGLSEVHPTLAPQAQVLNFINLMFSEVEGTNHRWLNKMHSEKLSFNKDGNLIVFLKISKLNSTLCDNREVVAMLERVKLLQQRHRGLSIFGLLCVNSVNSIAIQTQITQTIMENYVTFPILLFDKDFPEMLNGGCYLLFEGSRNRFLHLKLDVDIGIIVKEIEEFYSLNKSGAVMVQNPTVSGTPQRDKIGSSPGFEDGEFESAKLFRPAASFFDNAENSLYIVDSENNAIRRADMGRRVLETVYPVPVQKSSRIWSWIMDKLGFQRENALTPEVVDLDGVTLPWHLVKLGGDDLLIISRSFEMAWIMNMSTGEIKKVVRGTKTISEMYGHMILERVPSFKDACFNSFQQRLVHYFSLEGIPYASLMSSIASFKNYTVFCDAAAQKVLKCHRESRQVECVQLSNLGILGLPYWLVSPPERIFRSGNSCYQWNEHLRPFSVLPGRCNVKVNVDIPMETELIAPLDENCIWRQARGSAAELSRLDGPAAGSEKVGVAQQWFDELDNLAFSRPEDDLNPEEEEEKYSSKCSQDSDKVHFNCTVNVSPGIGEVVVSAVLYLKLKKAPSNGGQNSDSMRVLGLKSNDSMKPEEEICIKLLSDTCGNLQDMVFMKPLHLRIRLDCGDHPSADTQKEVISTETNLEVSISPD